VPRDKTLQIYDREQFSAWTQRNAPERRRERKSWGMYDATDYRQWDEQALRIMISEGRPPHSFNFIKRNVDSLAGSSLVEPYDIHYETEMGEDNDIAVLFNELYLEDRDIGHYAFQYLQALRAGYVYRGWLEMYKDKSRDPRGRVGIRYLPPDRVVTDPDWTTNDVKDNKALYIPRWMAPHEIKEKYKKSSLLLDVQIEMFKIQAGSSSQEEVDKLFDRSPEFYDQQNNLFLVWDKLELTRRTVQKLWDYDNGTWLPEIPDMEIDEILFHAEHAGRNIDTIPKEETICKVHSQCPALLLDLQSGNHPLQLNRYPLFSFSSDTINGRPNTPVDQLTPVQEAFNKRESVKTHILMTTGSNHLLVESDAVESPTKAHELIANRNKPGTGTVLEPGGINKVKNLERPNPPTEFMNDLDRLWKIQEQLTPAVPAVQGQGETGDSGVLFQAKVAQAQIGMQIPSKMIMELWHQLGDAYFYAAQQVYTYPMIFRSSRTKQEWALNYEGGIDMKTISRLRVTVTQSPASETYRRLLLQTYLSIAQHLPSPLTRQALSRVVIDTLPNVPEEEKAKLSLISGLEEELQTKLVKSQIMGLDMQMTQMQNPQMGMPPGGQPMPGQPPGQAPAPDPQAMLQQIMGAQKVGTV
jgi:hypothetical protein